MGVKRARVEASERLEQLLAVCAEEQARQEEVHVQKVAEQKDKLRATLEQIGDRELTTTQAVLAMSYKEREVVFRAVLERNEEVVENMLKNCVKTGEALKDSPIVATVVGRQMESIRALSWVLVAHLATMCGILRSTKDEAASLRHVANVIKAEIKRMGSAKLVFDMLQILIRDLDAALAKAQIHLLVGTVQDAAKRSFGIIKRGIASADNASHADDGRSEVSDKTETHVTDTASTTSSVSGAEKRRASAIEGFRISRPEQLADLLNCVERSKKRQRQREVIHDFSLPSTAALLGRLTRAEPATAAAPATP